MMPDHDTKESRPRPWFARPPWRVPCAAAIIALLLVLAYAAWTPGKNVRDGRHDLGRNGLWLAHGWMGDDAWFLRNGKRAEIPRYRSPEALAELVARLRDFHVTDVFPHLCPASGSGALPGVDDVQIEKLLDATDAAGMRVIPWIGGVYRENARLHEPTWRREFCAQVAVLFVRHPRFAGVQVNIEPCPSGDADYLVLLEQIRAALPTGKVLSVAAYPPPTRWQPAPEVHWDEGYFREVAKRVDQLAVMMYDTAVPLEKVYTSLMASWTREVLDWAEGQAVLLGLPVYEDAGTGYHDPRVENLEAALRGIHAGLTSRPEALAAHYQGAALYADWTLSQEERDIWRREFLHGRTTHEKTK